MHTFEPGALDATIHGPVRLGVMSALVVEGKLTFTELKKRLRATDGALGAHLQKLVDSGYIEADEGFIGQRPQTHFRPTPVGRRALERYVRTMRDLLDSLQRP
jgi:DNA-binding MarR family transcriptional regulator